MQTILFVLRILEGLDAQIIRSFSEPAFSKEDGVVKKLFCRYDLDHLDGLAVSKMTVKYNKTMIVNKIALVVVDYQKHQGW